MFANHGFTQSMTIGSLAVVALITAPAYGWQDFIPFEQMMRDADLPGNKRTSNQPTRQLDSLWPPVAAPENSRVDRGQLQPSRRSSQDGRSLSGEFRDTDSSNRRGRTPASNERRRIDSNFNQFPKNSSQPRTGAFDSRQPAANRNPARQGTGGPSANWPRPSESDFHGRSHQRGSGTGGYDDPQKSKLTDPFRNPRSQPARDSYTSQPPAGRSQPAADHFADYLALPASTPTSIPSYIRPTTQSGSAVDGRDSGFDAPRFQDFRSHRDGSSVQQQPPYSDQYDRTRSPGFGLGLDAGFGPPLPSRSLTSNRLPPEMELDADPSEFDWRTIRVSVGDIILPSHTIFQHADSVLSIPEETAYLNLLQEIEARKKALTLDPALKTMSANARAAVWEECFYAFMKARQLAFGNGKLRHESKSAGLRNGLADPFKKEGEQVSLTTRTQYDILDDIRRYPDHFTGRPIVLYGMFSPESDRTLSRTDGALDPTITTVEENPAEQLNNHSSIYGMVYDSQNHLTKATVTTGSLTSIQTGQLLATVDTSGLMTPRQGVQDIRSAWRDLPPFPVLIKGWVIKKFKGDRPLIYCESMRLLSPEPHLSLVQTHTYDKQRIRAEEKWLYYETLQQMAKTRPDMQQKLGHQNMLDRIDVLQSEIIDKFKADALALKARQADNKVTLVEYEKQLGSLNRQFQMRKKRYQRYRNSKDKFPTYVDLFQNPDEWHGKIVTLQGHVRHSVSYDSDATMSDGRPLYELWLFTEDSQHTPAVILTPEVPPNFPMDAEVVNQVTVTGCFFKRYVYTGQTERRIAPLILAGGIQWAPSVGHVASLVKSGDLSAGSPLAVRAKKLQSKQSGNWALILVSLVIIFGLMVLWGRAQREERDRLRLRDRIVDVKEIENGAPPEFASAADEFLNRAR